MKIIRFLIPPKIKKKEGETELELWRRSLFEKIFYVFFLAISTLIVPSTWGSFSYGVPVIGFFNIIIYFFVAFFYLNKSLSDSIRFHGIKIMLLVGLVILLGLGPHGAGFIWLFAYILFSSLIQKKRDFIRPFLLALIGLVILGSIIQFNWLQQFKLHDFTLMAFVLTAINTLGLAWVASASFKFILSRLENSLSKQKEQSERLEERNKLLQKTNDNLDNLIYSISHDIRSPLANIKGLSDLGMGSTDVEKAQFLFDRIHFSSTKLQAFTERITNYFKLEKEQLKVSRFHLRKVVENVFANHYRELLSEKDQIEIDIPENQSIETDETRVILVFMNLFSNAIKYRSKNRSLQIEIRARFKIDKVIITFKDNGVGISKEGLASVFQIFTRSTYLSSGAGLGLYIAQQCVESLGGKINVESQEGIFTVFEISIPKKLENRA